MGSKDPHPAFRHIFFADFKQNEALPSVVVIFSVPRVQFFAEHVRGEPVFFR